MPKTDNNSAAAKEQAKQQENAAPQNQENKNFKDLLYEKITEVIGGDNPNQYFCMTLPGTIIDPEKYAYDITAPKPAHVKANESRLVNKMYDACFITGADNGNLLPNQYKSALNMLSPKLNKDLFELKNQLREVLMTPYPYDFGNGIEEGMTLEQVFYRLYNEYVDAKAAWSQRQIDKKDELERLIIDKTVREDKYLEWYGAVAEGERVNLEEKLGKVLNVFAPSDMNIINSILNCGVGEEIEQARSNMSMVEELSPDGGYIYPVSLYPSNWFELLDTSFTGVDLLESPAALSQKLNTLQMQRSNILSQLNSLVSTIPDDEKLKSSKDAFEKAENEYHNSVSNCVNSNLGATADMVNAVVNTCVKEKNGQGKEETQVADNDSVTRTVNSGKDEDNSVKKEKVVEIVNAIRDSAIKCSEAQARAVEAGGKCVEKALVWCDEQNRQQLKSLLLPLQQNLNELNGQIDELQSQIAISKAVQKKDDTGAVADIMPNKSDSYFTQVLISSTMSALSSQSSKQTEASSSSTRASFFLGGYSSNKSHQKAVQSTAESNSKMSIEIGMNVAKVTIERSWFDPGLFRLTENMFNFSDSMIAPDNSTSFTEGDAEKIQERFRQMNESIFPSYPVAFVIAKDVSIRFASESGFSSSFAETVEDHASKGGGFLCFGSSSSSASSSAQSSTVASSSANSITVRFTAPQILGYYMQATAADKSTHINAPDEKDMSIIAFVSDFKLMMEDFAKRTAAQKA